MKRRLTRWLLPVLRYGLCAVAIVYLAYNVTWYDYAVLADGNKVRVLERNEGAQTLVIEQQGERTTIPEDREHLSYIKDTDVPKITLGIRGVVTRMDLGAALLAILIFLPVPVLQSIRLVWMLAVQDVRLSYWNSIKLSYAGNFFNFAMPGTVGGDLIKAYYVTRFTHQKTEAVTTVFLDRVIGLLGLMILATATFVASIVFDRVEWDDKLFHVLVTGLGFVWAGLFAGCILLFSTRLRHAILLPQLAERLPGGAQLLRIGRATVKMRQHKTLVVLSLGNTIVLQLIVLIAAYQMAQALRMAGSFDIYFIGVPIGFLIAAIPATPPQGFGVMEWVYVLFFARGGLNPNSAALAFALANRLTQLVWALPGLLVPLLGAHVPSHAELEQLERTDPELFENARDGGSPPTARLTPNE